MDSYFEFALAELSAPFDRRRCALLRDHDVQLAAEQLDLAGVQRLLALVQILFVLALLHLLLLQFRLLATQLLANEHTHTR